MPALSANEQQRFAEQGYVVPRYKLPESEITQLRLALDAVMSLNPDVSPELLVNAHIANANAEGIKGHQSFLELAAHPQLLDLVESVIGPNIILWGLHIFCKPASDGMEVPFHQDGEYWPIKPLATCTLWLAIDDSTIENGCLRVVPGSHREKRVYTHIKDPREQLVLTQTVSDEQCDTQDAVDVELRAGEMSLHDVYLVHGSNANTSERRRAGIAIRYMPASSEFARDTIEPGSDAGFHVDFSKRPLWLLRGHDSSGKNDFTVGH